MTSRGHPVPVHLWILKLQYNLIEQLLGLETKSNNSSHKLILLNAFPEKWLCFVYLGFLFKQMPAGLIFCYLIEWHCCGSVTSVYSKCYFSGASECKRFDFKKSISMWKVSSACRQSSQSLLARWRHWDEREFCIKHSQQIRSDHTRPSRAWPASGSCS